MIKYFCNKIVLSFCVGALVFNHAAYAAEKAPLAAGISIKNKNKPQNGAKEAGPGEGSPDRDDAPLSKKDLAGIAALAEGDESTIAQNEAPPAGISTQEPSLGVAPKTPVKTILINFNNVSIVEFIRFISRLSNKNFIFDEQDLQFNVTIISEEPTTLENVMSALLQELRIHNLTLLEEGNNIVIHKTDGVNSISRVEAENIPPSDRNTQLVTRLFRLNTADSDKIAALVRPLVSQSAIVEVFKDTNHLIVTDIVTNVDQIAELIQSLDAPNNGLVIGQYAVRQGYIDALIQLAQKIMLPITQDQTLIFIPHRAANSIFIVSTPFMMERTLAILQYLDQTQGITRIFDLKDLKFSPGIPAGATGPASQNQWELDSEGNWVFRPSQTPGIPTNGAKPPQGFWTVDAQGNWRFQAGTAPPSPEGARGVGVGPEGSWRLDPQGFWVYQLAPGKSITSENLLRPMRGLAELPTGHIERTQFFIQKLNYRKGDQVQIALQRIAESLRATGLSNADLVAAIDSIQWIEASNSLIVTGTVESLDKVRELIMEVDTPLRQVFIEMLILDTTINDALNFGVDWGTRFGGGNTSGAQAFLPPSIISPTSPFPAALNTTGVGLIPSAANLAASPGSGFSLGIIGEHLTHCGIRFNSIGALVRALHERTDSEIVLNPKILTEDNYPAEVFVGINTAFATQAIANDLGNIITQNFEFRDIGTRLRVTPLIGDNDIITLIIEEEDSSIAPALTGILTQNAGPTTRKSNTTTRVHLPNEFFLIMSGMMRDEDTRHRAQVPCLGGIPFIGAGFSDKDHTDQKRNLMIFIRPKIIDTEEEIQNITKHQQDVFKYKNRLRKSWRYEVDEALDFFNLPSDDDCCEDECKFNGCP